MITLKPIKNEEQYESYLERIYFLMQNDLKAKSKESNEVEILTILVKNYEDRHFKLVHDLM